MQFRIRCVVVFLFLTGCLFSLDAANENSREWFQFEMAPIDPLFREPLADPFSHGTSFRYVSVSDPDSVPHSVLVCEDGQYKEIAFEDDDFQEAHNFWHMKSAANIGLLRFTFGPIQMEGYLQGGINTVFQAFGSQDALGFDGMYGAGVTVRLFDIVAIQGGFHHFSGHWGDEILSNLVERGYDLSSFHLEEYTRGNSWMAGLSLEPTHHLRAYCFAELPMKSAWIRPGVHVPSFVIKPNSTDQSQFEYITGQEGLSGLQPYDDSYKAWRFQYGLEYRIPVSSFGSLFFAGDMQLHQDGQTLHQVNGYSADNPWETEYTVGGGFEFNQSLLGRKFRLEVYYHEGRFPLLNYFFQRSKYLVMGLAING
ncbi:MAG: hypothetical protein ACQ5SW_05755 [Sphaerochaetaceae bacterium]